MSYTHQWGGAPNNTASWWAYDNTYVYTDGIGFPTGNIDLNGDRRVYVESVSVDYVSGGTGNTPRILKDGSRSSGGAWFASGGSMRFELFSATGKTYFGRNTAASGSVQRSSPAYTWDGVLCGSLKWSTVPSRPGTLTAALDGGDVLLSWGGSSSNGGNSSTTYGIRYSDNGGSTWSATINVGLGTSYTLSGLAPGKSYVFMVFLSNSRGSSQSRQSASLFVPAGGQRWTGTSEVPVGAAVRWDGSAEVALETAVRWDGTQEVPLS